MAIPNSRSNQIFVVCEARRSLQVDFFNAHDCRLRDSCLALAHKLRSARDWGRHPFHKTRLPVSASRLAQDMKLSSRYIFHDGWRRMVPPKNVFVPQVMTINSIPIFKLRI